MSTIIKCPHCNQEFPLEAALTDELNELLESKKNEYRDQMNQFLKNKEAEFGKKEEALKQQEIAAKKQWEEDVKKRNAALEETLRKSLTADFENQIQLLKTSAEENEEKLKTARAKELEYLRKENELKNREAELEISVQKKLQEERAKLSEEIRQIEEQKNAAKETEHQLKVRELEKQLEDQKILVDEMKRKSEQGSMQLQGEAQELLLEDILRSIFPFDVIEEVGKGVTGADCVQTVRNHLGNEAGKIIFESKRTKTFSVEWLDKLKKDMRDMSADIAIIVTQTLPKDMERFGEKEGIYICTFYEVRSVVTLLRSGLLRLAELRKGQENKGDKMAMLYDYLTGHEFSEQWNAIREGFLAMRNSIQKERDQMERLWKAREKQLEKVLLNATHIRGSIEGIAGADTVNLNLLEGDDDSLLLE